MNTLVLIHGALGSASQYEALASLLSEKHEIHCADLKGHGKRADALPFTIPSLTDDLIAYLYDNNLHDVNLFGYSMGGYVALSAAQQKPQLIKSVMTLGTKFSWDVQSAEKEALMLNPDEMIEKIPAFIDQLMQQHGDTWEKLVLNTASMMRHLALLPLSDADFSSIRQKVRLMRGDKDNMVTLSETEHVFQLLQKGSMVVMPDTKHPFDKVDVKRLAYEIHYFFEN